VILIDSSWTRQYTVPKEKLPKVLSEGDGVLVDLENENIVSMLPGPEAKKKIAAEIQE
jgi:hypothetical protein